MLHAFKVYSALKLSLLVYIYPAFILILFNTIYWGVVGVVVMVLGVYSPHFVPKTA